MLQDELETFISIVRTGSLTKAADELYISQSALSHRIQSLEKKLDMELILRKRGQRRVELTMAGEQFLRLAEQWQSLQLEIQNFHSVEISKTITFTALDSVNTFVIPRVLQRFSSRGLPVSISIFTARSMDAYPFIENRRADFAIISTLMNNKHLLCTPLYSEHMKFICDSGSDYPDPVHPSLLPSSREVFNSWTPAFQIWHDYWFGTNAKPHIAVDKVSLIQDYLHNSNCWTIAPANMANMMAAKDGMRCCELLEPPPDRAYYLLIHHMTVFDSYTKQFINDLSTEISALPDSQLLFGDYTDFTPIQHSNH